MKLDRKDRWILSNQLRILEALYPSEAQYHRQNREALESGYEFHYPEATQHVYPEEYTMTVEECKEVINILTMFDHLRTAYEELGETAGIDKWAVEFSGFDGNNETKQMAYARYFCSLDGGRFQNLSKGDDFNSHRPVLGVYQRMLVQWRKSTNPHNLSKEDVKRIVSAWTESGD